MIIHLWGLPILIGFFILLNENSGDVEAFGWVSIKYYLDFAKHYVKNDMRIRKTRNISGRKR
ncbi:MAG: hypothetical protein LLG93_04175 [Deltaproteobacteria bacterium]|nr:hypothetical protein [Deltaproteobacteria bacterium]